jgi:hypothetical protein
MEASERRGRGQAQKIQTRGPLNRLSPAKGMLIMFAATTSRFAALVVSFAFVALVAVPILQAAGRIVA